MGIVFMAPDAPSATKPVDYGDGEVVDETFSTLPEVSVSGVTGGALIALLGLEGSSWGGEIAVEALPAAIERAMRIINGGDVSSMVIEPSVRQGEMRLIEANGAVATVGRGATVVDVGLTDERVRRRMADLLDLLTQARRGGYKVCWA